MFNIARKKQFILCLQNMTTEGQPLPYNVITEVSEQSHVCI